MPPHETHTYARRALFYDGNAPKPGLTEYSGSNTVFTTRFKALPEEPVLLKVAFSYVDAEGARKNFKEDFPEAGFAFEHVRQAAKEEWRRDLNVVQVEGGTPRDRAVFASCLFFALQDPRNVSDADGRYRVADKVFEKPDFRYRTVFSGWDVFRSEMPLLGLLRPKDLSDTVNSLLATRLATGRKWLPVWDLFGCDSACMLGNPAISAILEAHAEGIRTFDANEALAACVSTSHADVRGMPTRGYANSWMALSTTLELAYASWCTGALAERLGKPEMATPYYDISRGYTNCWCRKVDWMRSRSPDGGWLKWEGLTTKWQGAIECNPYQQGWFVPHDPEGLMNLCGGPRRFAERLESFMRQSPGRFASNAYYNHSNEPVHLIPFLFHHADRPDLTQKWTRRICANAYDIGPRGLCGNEDEGQMSAWYVLCAMGLHPSCPGAGTWMITSPLFSKVTICLDQDYYKGRFFTVLANGNSESNIYIQSAKLNGKPLDRLWLNYDEVTCGGELELQMGPKPPTVNWMRPPNPLATVR